MAQKVLIMGESGTGKTASLRNLNPETTGIVNPVGKPLPFRGQFDMLNGHTDSERIIEWVKAAVNRGKKIIIVDDFQYILSVPYMNRIHEAGWDKWNDFGSNYFDIIDMCDDLPDDVTVYYLTHTETLENGVTTIKLIGKLLREKITIEGLFTTVLRTQVSDGKYYFLTQNSGSDTVKSPIGMFPSYAIENDLNYVDDKIRNYYQIGDFKSDEEIAEADKAAEAPEVEKGKRRSRRRRGVEKACEEADKAAEELSDDDLPFESGEREAEKEPKPEETPTPVRRTSKVRN